MNERIVVATASPFGSTGPRRNWAGSTNTAWAASGMLAVTGDDDRPPVVPPLGLGDAVTSLNAAMGALLALRAARRGGRGQLVDISMQEAVLSVSMEAGPQLTLEGRPPGRVPRVRLPAGGIHGADADNAVDVQAFLPGQWDALAEWIAEELGIDEARLDVFQGGIVARMPYSDTITAWIVELAGRSTKQEFFLEAQRRGIPCGAVLDAADLLHDPQLEAIDGWEPTPAPQAPDFQLPRGPLAADGRRSASGAVPAPGQHDDEILGPLRPRP